MDTLAMALAQDKQLPRALEVQRKAVQAQPDNGALRLNLAKIYLESGDKVAARGELDTLAKLGDNFPAQSEVTQLLKGL
jgi:FimV-like protein